MKTLIDVFNALADHTRLRIVNLLLASPELCVCDIEEILQEPQTKISRHLAYLRARGVVEASRKGKWMHYTLGPALADHTEFSDVLRRIIRDEADFASDIEHLLEGLDNQDVVALQDADEPTIRKVIYQCCAV